MKKYLLFLFFLFSCHEKTEQRTIGYCVWMQQIENSVTDNDRTEIQVNNYDLVIDGLCGFAKGDSIVGKFDKSGLIEIKDTTGEWFEVISTHQILKY